MLLYIHGVMRNCEVLSRIHNLSVFSSPYFRNSLFYLLFKQSKFDADYAMGAKTVGEKRVSTCHICQATFAITRALKTHILEKHSTEVSEPKEAVTSSEQPNKDDKQTALVTPTTRVSKRLQQRKKSGDEYTMAKPKLQQLLEGRKSAFECPKCSKIFPVYFSALKHVQKQHSNDSDATENSTDSPGIKPIQIEICMKCDKRVTNDEHVCEEEQTTSQSENEQMYSCLGCKKKFKSVHLFDQHVSVSHGNSVDKMVFKNISEFLQWKYSMETQLRVKYLTLHTSDIQYYQCNYVSPKNSSTVTHLCPSMVSVKEMPKGVQIKYFKNHHEHTCPEYQIPKLFHENVVNDSMGKDRSNDEDFDSLITNTASKNDPYTAFKDLLDSVIARSVNINSNTLKRLHKLAIDMNTIIETESKTKVELDNKKDYTRANSFDDDDNRDEFSQESEENSNNLVTSNRSMTDEEISKVLEPRTSARLKRKSESSTPIVEKKKKIVAETKPGIKDNNSISKDVNSPKVSKPAHVFNSPSFNDSYKDFIGSSEKTSTLMTKKALNVNNKSNQLQSNTKKNLPRKEVVKTKIGQFIPSPEKLKKFSPENSLSKKKPKLSMSSTPSKLANINLDLIKYEVVEQENDCNILVLKI